ncbi:hypothetical protein [Comamonas thiooxydans]|uniref:hypothetical protein n=1 Tax=Comamonas thiooxydans TaxID=363952 RepID=UPI000B40BC78|nr:hypothetical protein [Comamonas thiooxydans]
MKSTQPSTQAQVVSLATFKTDKVMARATELMQSLSPLDLEVLQHDLYSPDTSYRPVPAVLAEHFEEWLREYGIEAETMMAHENRDETQHRFYVELADQTDDPQLQAFARQLLSGQSLVAIN